MPYIDGKRVTNEEWTERFGSIERLHTGPRGENPGSGPEMDTEIGVPKQKKGGRKAGSARSKRSEKSAKAAVADAMGVSADSEKLADIDVSGLDADAKDTDSE